MSTERQAFSDARYDNIFAGRGKDSDKDVPSLVSKSLKRNMNDGLEMAEMDGIGEGAVS